MLTIRIILYRDILVSLATPSARLVDSLDLLLRVTHAHRMSSHKTKGQKQHNRGAGAGYNHVEMVERQTPHKWRAARY